MKAWLQAQDRVEVFEAFPGESAGRGTIGRQPIPHVDDGDPSRFVRPPEHQRRLHVPVGASRVNFQIVQGGPSLVGELALPKVEAPVGVKTVAEGCMWTALRLLRYPMVPVLVLWFIVLWVRALRVARDGRSGAG